MFRGGEERDLTDTFKSHSCCCVEDGLEGDLRRSQEANREATSQSKEETRAWLRLETVEVEKSN